MKLKKIIAIGIFVLVLAGFLTSNLFSAISVYAEVDYDVKSYCLIDANSGEILKEKNSEEKLEVASMVKLMTSLLVMEKIEAGEWSLETPLLVSDYAASMEGSQAFLDAGKSYSVDDLLKSVIVASANDSSVVFAESYAGTENAFVDFMNKRAQELDMNNTLYGNATGLPALNQYSTAKDIAILLNEVSKHSLYHNYSKIWMDKLVHESGRITELVNTNRLIKYYPGCECGKTGFTDEAGYCLSVQAKRDNLNLISVVMGAKSSNDRFNSSSSLLNYGFANFKSKKVVDCDNIIKTGRKIKGVSAEIECKAEKSLFITEKNGTTKAHEIKTELFDIKSPVMAGDIIGSIEVIVDGEVKCKADLLATENYVSPTFTEIFGNVINNWRI